MGLCIHGLLYSLGMVLKSPALVRFQVIKKERKKEEEGSTKAQNVNIHLIEVNL